MTHLRSSRVSCLTIALVVICASLTSAVAVAISNTGTEESILSDGSWIAVSSQGDNGNKEAGSTYINDEVRLTSRSAPGWQMPVNLVNKYGAGPLYAYVVGYNASGAHLALLPSGQWFHPQPTSSTVPQSLEADISWPLPPMGLNTTITIPGTVISGRVYISDGELDFFAVMTSAGPRLVEPGFLDASDPNADRAWSVVEVTLQDNMTVADITYVDFVSLQLSLEVQNASNASWVVSGINASAAESMCEDLQGYATTDGQPWDKLCQHDIEGRLTRIVAPHKFISVYPQAFQGYYDVYVREVYQHFYENTTLQVTGPESLPASIPCRTDKDQMSCDGASRTFETPTTEQIFGCNGTLGVSELDNDIVALVVPRLCAAFQRSTLLLDGGRQQPGPPGTMFYQSSPTNRYAQLVHHYAPDGIGYAFAFDDVHSKDARDESGLLHRSDATSITITVGSDSYFHPARRRTDVEERRKHRQIGQS